MKNILALLFIALSINLCAQDLANTEWDVYLDGQFDISVRLSEDTFYVADESFEFAISTYYTLSDTFAITDIENIEEGCSDDYGQVEGTYIYQISNDTLTFSVIEDSCQIRVEVLDVALFIKKEATAINDIDQFEDVVLFPNPITDGILNIQSNVQFDKIEVNDISGKVLISTDHAKTIDLNAFPNNIFIVSLFKDGKSISKKVFKY